MARQTTEQAIEEIWQLFRDTAARFKETDAKFKETDAKFKETDARLAQTLAETQAEVAKTSAGLRKLEGLFGNQWGRLLEALVKPGVLALFQQRGHDVRRLHERSEARIDGYTMEVDLILADLTEVIAVEVKTKFSAPDVDEFVAELAIFTTFFPAYAAYRVYGAVAGLDMPADVARYAYRQGLYVLDITGEDLVQILNDDRFRPKDFGRG